MTITATFANSGSNANTSAYDGSNSGTANSANGQNNVGMSANQFVNNNTLQRTLTLGFSSSGGFVKGQSIVVGGTTTVTYGEVDLTAGTIKNFRAISGSLEVTAVTTSSITVKLQSLKFQAASDGSGAIGTFTVTTGTANLTS